ncbi:hypothetical protein BEQ56_08315 [Anaerolineaceae bacterium oral taxon 439]|nr:hypothetical protein BEQ56_08315 [Anaerolineaceae bacterium oral taxon 439]
MKKIVVMLLLLVSILSLTAGAFAQQFYVYENPDDSEETIKIPVDQSHVIGTIRFCVEEAQRLPAEIDGAICDGDDDAYNSKMAELASCIAQANSAMADTKMPNTLNLWRVYSILKEKNCGVGAAATSHADWAREELDRVSFRIGAIDPGYDPIRMCGTVPYDTPMPIASPSMFARCSADLSADICAGYVLTTCINDEPRGWGPRKSSNRP